MNSPFSPRIDELAQKNVVNELTICEDCQSDNSPAKQKFHVVICL